MSRELAHVNRHGVLTINSQPAVNGMSSTDPVVGWGEKGGYVYQRVSCERGRERGRGREGREGERGREGGRERGRERERERERVGEE